jgi:hypothetical protein
MFRTSNPSLSFILALAAFAPLCDGGFVQAAEPNVVVPKAAGVDFNRDVRPILASSCFACHGPDAQHREAGLRLDQRPAAIAPVESGAVAIVPGSPAKSELYRRITSSDNDLRMPPKDSGHPLSAAQKETLRRWIEAGAEYAQHWSLQPIRSVPLPAVHDKSWPRNGLDAFVLARLEQEGLKPSREADRYALLRRVSLDLTGLPPTPAEVEAFAGDKSPDAYEKVVDRLLADPAYGERWARMWLDLARYADSKGYGSDPVRTIWRYRDWVIDAFNRNLPYDQFTIEQLAGDLLPGRSDEQLMATAFHRNTMTNTEGGTDDEEFRVAAVKDRVDTTVQVWMGLTMGCAKCHSHKYDPITQEDYYRFFAFFNQTADADRPDESPTIEAPPAAMREEAARIDASLASLKKELDDALAGLAPQQAKWEASVPPEPKWQVVELLKAESEQGSTLTAQPDGSLLASGKTPDTDMYVIGAQSKLARITAFRLEALPDPSLPGGGSGRSDGGNFVLSRFSITATAAAAEKEKAKPRDVALSRAWADFSPPGYLITSVLAPKANAATGWSLGGRSTKPHVAVFVAAKPLENGPNDAIVFRLEQAYRNANNLIGRFRLSVTDDPKAGQRYAVPFETLTILDSPADKRPEPKRVELARYYQSIAPELAPKRKQIADLEKTRPKFPTLPVMQELPAEKLRQTHILVKGNFLSPGEKVTPGVPKALHALPAGAPTSRLGVAEWLVDEQNPLTARVAVNRYWAQLFGVGLVATEEDFGTQGAAPSHPELLDWLAAEFMHLHWDTKALLKLIVTSATYRQSSRVTAELLERDPNNRLLSRGPRFRLEAEMVRDQALSLSGLLSRKVHGPSVYPPQPAGLWQAAFNGADRTWATSAGEDRYRRAIYTFWRRTVPYPSLATFDAPSREICSMRRIRTNTPLQAFVTLNDPVYVEAAQALARRLVREGGTSVEDRVRFGLRLCLARPAHPQQVDELAALYRNMADHYREHSAEAEKTATDPLGKLPADMNAGELAAWTVVANVLLNLDGVLTKG